VTLHLSFPQRLVVVSTLNSFIYATLNVFLFQLKNRHKSLAIVLWFTGVLIVFVINVFLG